MSTLLKQGRTLFIAFIAALAVVFVGGVSANAATSTAPLAVTVGSLEATATCESITGSTSGWVGDDLSVMVWQYTAPGKPAISTPVPLNEPFSVPAVPNIIHWVVAVESAAEGQLAVVEGDLTCAPVEPTLIDLPPAPTLVDDPAVEGDAHYVVPADTAMFDYELLDDGSVSVCILTPNTLFSVNGKSCYTWLPPVDKYTPPPSTGTITWGQQGRDKSSPVCVQGQATEFHFSLAPAGGKLVDPGTLTVTFKDGTTASDKGEVAGDGAAHYYVGSDYNAVAVSAVVTGASWTGSTPLLTLSSSGCTGDAVVTPVTPPKPSTTPPTTPAPVKTTTAPAPVKTTAAPAPVKTTAKSPAPAKSTSTYRPPAEDNSDSPVLPRWPLAAFATLLSLLLWFFTRKPQVGQKH